MRIVRLILLGCAVAIALAIGGMTTWRAYLPSCTADIVGLPTELEASDRELKSVAASDVQSKCQVYRRRVQILLKTEETSQFCGPPQSMPRDVWPVNGGERRDLQQRIARECR